MKSLVLLGCFLSLSAFAGKLDREYKKTEFDPSIKKMTDAFKTASGCDLKLEFVGKDFESQDNMVQAKYLIDSITEGVGPYCLDKETQKPDADSQKAVCKLKTLKVQIGKETGFDFKDSVGTATIAATGGYTGFDIMMAKIDL
jgi:hypothetical protein